MVCRRRWRSLAGKAPARNQGRRGRADDRHLGCRRPRGQRLAQELIVNDHVGFLGAGLTPSAMAMAPLATKGKVATVVMVSGTSVVTQRSPYYLRTSFTLGQHSGIIADWAIKTGSKKAVSILSDWAPSAEAGNVFAQHFTKAGGTLLDTLIRRTRARQVGNQARRPRRHRRRRRPAGTGNTLIGHRRHLLGRASLGAQPTICRRLSEDDRPPRQFHLRRRL